MVQVGPPRETAHSAQHQCPSSCCNCAAPVALRPVTGNSQHWIYERKKTSESSPAWPNPGIQHPANGGTHEAEAQPDAHDRVSTYHLAGRQYQPLRRRILGHVGWLLDDVKILKMDPHGMSWICQPPVGKGVRGKQIAKFVRKLRFADSHERSDGCAAGEGYQSDQRYCKPSFPRDRGDQGHQGQVLTFGSRGPFEQKNHGYGFLCLDLLVTRVVKAPHGRAFRPRSIGRQLEGHHPDPVEWGFLRLGPDGTSSFRCPRAQLSRLWSLKV